MLRAMALGRTGVPRLTPWLSSMRYASTQSAAAATNQQAAAVSALNDEKTYFVHRTGVGGQLPVYLKLMGGGTLYQTRVRKITGRVEDLKTELQKVLQLADDKIKINPTNRDIVIKGRLRKQVAEYLESQRF